MRKDNSIYNKKQPGLYIYLYLQSQIPTSCYSGKKTIRHFHGKISPYFRFSKKNIFSLQLYKGDLVNQQSHELDGFQEILSQLYAPDGVYSILGNHDYGSYYHWQSPKAEIANLDYLIRQQKAMGWKLLNNEHDILHHKGDSIALIGVENDGEPPFSQFADLPQAMQGTEGMFQILLSHNPTHWRREVLPQSDISLMLAGHTHAMQGILFGHSLAELIYPEWRGMYYEGKRALYVNIGIGYVGLPFRFGAWPEITVLKLVREKE